jgi:lipoprotein-releasing system permease protein
MVSFISLSSIIGIAVGVAVIIVGLSAMNGFERELKDRVLSVIPHGEYTGVKGPLTNWLPLVERLNEQPTVTAAAPFVKMTALAEKGKQLKAVEIRGIIPSREAQVTSLSDYIENDAYAKLTPGENELILGKGIAEHLDVEVGESITLMIPVQSQGNQVQAPKRVRAKVVGLVSIGGQLDYALGLMHLSDAQVISALGEGVSGISVKTTDVLDAQKILKQAGNKLDAYVYINSWRKNFGYIYRDIQLVRTIMYLVMVLVISVACFNIVSTLMMAVKDRAGDIAILRTMGAQDKLIRKIFIWQGAFSGVLGGLIGSVIGVFFALNLTSMIEILESLIGYQFLSGDIYFVDFLPSQVQAFDVTLVTLTSIVLSLLATLYPAHKASQLNPAQVLSSK